MSDFDLKEIRAQISALSTLFWHWKDENSLPDDFGWGVGLLLHKIYKDIEEVEKKLIEENKQGAA